MALIWTFDENFGPCAVIGGGVKIATTFSSLQSSLKISLKNCFISNKNIQIDTQTKPVSHGIDWEAGKDGRV